MTDADRLLTYRVDQHEKALAEIRDAVKSIDKSLQLLSLVEVQSGKQREQLAEVATRVGKIEMELPTLKLARKWVLAAMTTMGGAVGAGMLALVVK